jgi:hypothetical protein
MEQVPFAVLKPTSLLHFGPCNGGDAPSTPPVALSSRACPQPGRAVGGRTSSVLIAFLAIGGRNLSGFVQIGTKRASCHSQDPRSTLSLR